MIPGWRKNPKTIKDEVGRMIREWDEYDERRSRRDIDYAVAVWRQRRLVAKEVAEAVAKINAGSMYGSGGGRVFCHYQAVPVWEYAINGWDSQLVLTAVSKDSIMGTMRSCLEGRADMAAGQITRASLDSALDHSEGHCGPFIVRRLKTTTPCSEIQRATDRVYVAMKISENIPAQFLDNKNRRR